jgi:hypothetical protein
VTQMPAGKRSRAGTFLFTFTDEERFCVSYTAIESLIQGPNALLSLRCLIPDQAFRGGWSLPGCRLEFLAARIVVRNKEVLNFA